MQPTFLLKGKNQMSKYYKRILTYDSHTENYKCEIPELSIEVLGDTEVSALVFAREEIELYAKRVGKVVQDTKQNTLDVYSEYQD